MNNRPRMYGTTGKRKPKITEVNGIRVGDAVSWFPSKVSVLKKAAGHHILPAEVVAFKNTRVQIQVYLPDGSSKSVTTEQDNIQKRNKPNE